MKSKILTWLIDTLKDFRKELIAFAVASGIGALFFCIFKKNRYSCICPNK